VRARFVPEYAQDGPSLPVQGAAHLVAGVRCAGSDLCAADRSGAILGYEFGSNILLTHIREDQADLDGKARALVAHTLRSSGCTPASSGTTSGPVNPYSAHRKSNRPAASGTNDFIRMSTFQA
jgi:hypothetical protein